MIDIDIICPVYKNPYEVNRLCESLQTQSNVNFVNVVFAHTLSNEKIDEDIRKIIKKYNYKSFELTKYQYSHSLTRDKCIREYCTSKVIILLSEDVYFKNEYALYNIANEINDEVVYAYGKQVCNNHSIEKYVREYNYGDKDIVVSKEDYSRLQLMAFFASDAFSAINREVFLKVGGYNGYNVLTNEDQLYAKIILDAGYKKKYVANAICYHAHRFTLKQLYRRYYRTGKFYKDIEIFNCYKKTNAGKKLSLYVFRKALMQFNIPVLIRFPFDMMARYLGLRKGMRA